MCAGGGREGWRAVFQNTSREKPIDGEGSRASICQEPATTPSPPALRVYVNGLSPFALGSTEGHRASARRFFNPYECDISMINEEKET